MSDFRLGVQASASPTNYVDNELVTYNDGTTQAVRQRVRIGGATGTQLANVIADGSLQVSDARELVNGTITAVNGTTVLTPAGDNSSWSVQVSGTWVGTLTTEVTLDGTNWIAVNSRQSAGGRLANNFSVNGLYRGVFGGMASFRVRASAWTSGTATVYIALGTTAAIFSNSDLLVQQEAQYYASSAGLNSAWGVCSQEISLATAGTEYPAMWFFNNDSAGGRVIYLSKVTKGGNGPIKIRRYRTGPGGTQMTRTSGGTLLTINNRANQAATATAGVAYNGSGSALVIANIPTYFEKETFIGGNGSGGLYQGGMVETNEDGSIIVPPQTGLYYTIIPAANTLVGVVEVTYWDGSTLT